MSKKQSKFPIIKNLAFKSTKSPVSIAEKNSKKNMDNSIKERTPSSSKVFRHKLARRKFLLKQTEQETSNLLGMSSIMKAGMFNHDLFPVSGTAANMNDGIKLLNENDEALQEHFRKI